MLGQSKTAFQAEIDSACELIDFWRFNPFYAQQLYEEQPISDHSMWNQVDYRPLEGFVYAVTPFNFTAIGGNLPTAPALMGNVVLWKPASSAIPSAYFIQRLLEEAGLPPGVINLVPGDARPCPTSCSATPTSRASTSRAPPTSSTACGRRSARAWPATGATRASWARPAARTSSPPTPPPIPQALAVAIVRGGFEYQGQKCSAASRVYVPQSLWGDVRDRVAAMIEDIRMGDVRDFRNFMGAVIDRKAFDKHPSTSRTRSRTPRVVAGGSREGEQGYFIQPTLVETQDPGYRLMQEEIFGPVVTAYPYDDAMGGDPRARGPNLALRPDRRRLRPRPGAPCARPPAPCATPPATSTSTTSPRARWWASSPSAAPAPRAPTTRPARS